MQCERRYRVKKTIGTPFVCVPIDFNHHNCTAYRSVVYYNRHYLRIYNSVLWLPISNKDQKSVAHNWKQLKRRLLITASLCSVTSADNSWTTPERSCSDYTFSFSIFSAYLYTVLMAFIVYSNWILFGTLLAFYLFYLFIWNSADIFTYKWKNKIQWTQNSRPKDIQTCCLAL